MNINRRVVLSSALAAALPYSVWAQRLPREGVDYKVVNPPQPNSTKTQVDIIEFFWYGCPHCYVFQPVLLEWEKIKPADGNFFRVPVAFDPSREVHSRIYYALEVLRLVEKYQQRVFYAIHKEKNPMLNESSIADYMAKAGIERATWLKAFNSKEVRDKAANARKIADAYRIEGTPEIAVGGRYRTSPSMTGGNAAVTMATVNYLAAIVRKSQGRG